MLPQQAMAHMLITVVAYFYVPHIQLMQVMGGARVRRMQCSTAVSLSS